MRAQDAFNSLARESRQRIGRLVNELRERAKNVPRIESVPPLREFSKVTQHPSVELRSFRDNVSRLADQIQDEDLARLLEPTGPKVLKGKNPHLRPKTAIIALAAQRAYEKRMAREKFDAAMASLATQRRA